MTHYLVAIEKLQALTEAREHERKCAREYFNSYFEGATKMMIQAKHEYKKAMAEVDELESV